MLNHHPKNDTGVRDTCSEAAYRLNAIIKAVSSYNNSADLPCEGFHLSMLEEVLGDISEALLNAAHVEVRR